MVSHLVMLVLTAIAIGVVGGVSKTFVVKDFGSAFIAAFVMTIVGWLAPLEVVYNAVAPLMFGAAEPGSATDASQYVWLVLGAFIFVVNTLLLFLVALVAPGIELRGVFGLIVAAAVITVVDMVAPRWLL